MDDGPCYVALYARVSTDKQDETLQLPRLRQMAQQRGFEVYKEYQDEASGKDQNRPAWKQLMQDAQDGRFSVVMQVKLDRIMRSVVNLDAVMSQLDAYGVKLITEDMGEVDTSKPNGKFMMTIVAQIQEWERETIKRRTQDALDEKKRQGVKLGRKKRDDLPIGYIAQDRALGMSWSEISSKYRIPKTTLHDRKRDIEAVISKQKWVVH